MSKKLPNRPPTGQRPPPPAAPPGRVVHEGRLPADTPAPIPSMFESAKVVTLRPGDVLVFRCPTTLSEAQRARATEVLNATFGDFETVILDHGQDLAVIRPEPSLITRAVLWLRGRHG